VGMADRRGLRPEGFLVLILRRYSRFIDLEKGRRLLFKCRLIRLFGAEHGDQVADAPRDLPGRRRLLEGRTPAGIRAPEFGGRGEFGRLLTIIRGIERDLEHLLADGFGTAYQFAPEAGLQLESISATGTGDDDVHRSIPTSRIGKHSKSGSVLIWTAVRQQAHLRDAREPPAPPIGTPPEVLIVRDDRRPKTGQ
jgi:hypothetical protein